MFARINGKTVSTDPDFTSALDIGHIEYCEGRRFLYIGYERLVGIPRLAVHISETWAWQPPFRSETISPEKKQEIIANVCSALEFNDLTYVLV